MDSLFKTPRTDAKHAKSDNDIGGDIQAINLDVVAEIEKDIEACDLVSLIFLLYDSPDVALERLTIFLKVFKDLGEKYHFNLLQDWAKQNISNPKWQYMFLEALTICQLYKIVRKLGFQVPIIKRQYSPNDLQSNFYVNPMKKALYRLCEHVTQENFQRLKSTLNTYNNINIVSENYLELIILELMCLRFIFVDSMEIDTKYDIENLAKIIDNFPQIKKFSVELREIQNRITGGSTSYSSNSEIKEREVKEPSQGKVTSQDLGDIWNLFDKMELEESVTKNFKSDTKKNVDMYPIKNPKNVGVCYIINQVNFNLSEESIKNKKKSVNLETRLGSDKDVMVLEYTMQSLNFEVIRHRNLDRLKMIESIKEIVKYRVCMDHSIFLLCILSHGVKDHVYAADSQLVNVQDIEHIVETGLEKQGLHDIPKVLILQACQVNDDEPEELFAADGPKKYIIRKYHFLTCWATAPELEAFRNEKTGSIFIQCLCYFIKKYSKHEQISDILTIVNKYVNKVCEIKQLDQVPIYKSTMIRKLFLQIPD